MQRELGKDIKQGAERIEFLDSNCDKVEDIELNLIRPYGVQANRYF